MGCLYSMYSIEDRKIISISKRYEKPTKSRFLKIKEALNYRNDHVKILQTANCMINYLFRIFNYSKKRFDSLKKECPANFLPFCRDF